jgi:low affinity Fe/Cu permease
MSEQKPDIFTRFTTKVSSILGRPWVFILALSLLVLWACSGPLLGFSDTWQLIVNTSTTIITFLTVFIIQNTQNRDSLAINIKLDAIMKKQGITSENLLAAEKESDKDLEDRQEKIEKPSTSERRKNNSRARGHKRAAR